MWLANRLFPSVRKLQRENQKLRSMLAQSKQADIDDQGNWPAWYLPYESRSNYKTTWTMLSETAELAMLHVCGTIDESAMRLSAEDTRRQLQATVGIHSDDTVLEIGCGIGRVGQEVAPLCQRWIGADVSPKMIGFARERLRENSNVEFVEMSGYDLSPVPSQSVSVAYCTVVFMHLTTWDRFAYVQEAYRVLRPGGRLFVDNIDLCTEHGRLEFQVAASIPRHRRPAHIGELSTPQELETYLKWAGFQDVTCETYLGKWASAWGVRPRV